MKKYLSFLPLFFLFLIVSCNNKPVEPIVADIVIYNGTIYDGSGEKPYIGSIGIKDDRLVYVGENTNEVERLVSKLSGSEEWESSFIHLHRLAIEGVNQKVQFLITHKTEDEEDSEEVVQKNIPVVSLS